MLTVGQIGIKILRVVRPDLAKHLNRYLQWRMELQSAPVVMKPLKDLKPGPIRHETLPDSILVRLKLLCRVFDGLPTWTLPEAIDSFSRDLDPRPELAIMERVALAYSELAQDLPSGHSERVSLYARLVWLTFQSADLVERLCREGDPLANALARASQTDKSPSDVANDDA